MSRQRSRIKGAASFRRMLRRLPDSAREELATLLTKAGPVLADRMRSRIRKRTGALSAAIAWRVLPRSLNLKVGLITKAKQRDLFYGHILDVGNKAKTVIVKRGPRKGSSMRIPSRQPLHLERQALTDFRTEILPDYRKVSDGILANAAQGAGDD